MVSVIIPVYNSQEYIEECIESVLNQTFTDWELILIDDCSDDLSRQFIEEYAKLDSRIKFYYFDDNVGAAIVRNKGIEMAQNRFIAFLDSDDFWHKDKLQLQIDFMLLNNVGFSFTQFFELDKNNKPNKIITPPEIISSFSLLFNNYIKTLTVIYDTKKIGKVYMPNYRKRQDWGMWFNILKKSEKAHCLSIPLAFYRTSNNSLSKNKLQLLRENFNFYRNYFNKTVISSFFMMILFLVFHFSFKISGNKKLK